MPPTFEGGRRDTGIAGRRRVAREPLGSSPQHDQRPVPHEPQGQWHLLLELHRRGRAVVPELPGHRLRLDTRHDVGRRVRGSVLRSIDLGPAHASRASTGASRRKACRRRVRRRTTRTFTGPQGKDQYALKHNPSTVFRECTRTTARASSTFGADDLASAHARHADHLQRHARRRQRDFQRLSGQLREGFASAHHALRQLARRPVPAWLANGATVIITFDEACCQLFTVAVGPDPRSAS